MRETALGRPFISSCWHSPLRRTASCPSTSAGDPTSRAAGIRNSLAKASASRSVRAEGSATSRRYSVWRSNRWPSSCAAGENPTFDRNPIPGVDGHCWPAIAGADTQPEERILVRLQEQKLAPVLFRQSADVADRLLGSDLGCFARGLYHFHRVIQGACRCHFLEPEWTMVVQDGLKLNIGMQPLRDFRQNLFARADRARA